MSDVNETQNDEQDAISPLDEIGLLKERAKLMGIKFSNNIGLEALKTKIAAKMEPKTEETAILVPVLVAPGETAPASKPTRPQTAAELHAAKRKALLANAMKLVRLRITNLDPKKKDLPGAIYTIANKYIGTVKKYVPFGEVTENGYHVPNIIYEHLKQKKFLNLRTTKRNGREHVEKSWAQEFALDVLPPLTREELAKLAAAQAATNGLES